MATAERDIVEIDGRRLSLSNLDKVIYPDTGTTKREVIAYYAAVAETMLPHLGRRPITRKRWPDGTAAHSFFHKDLEVSAPTWVPRWPITHDGRTIRYPTADSPSVIVWLAQIAALELHVPQWQLSAEGAPQNPDRVVFDLDPGPGVPLSQCAEVAFAVKDHLDVAGLLSVPVTSGSKGIHLYSRLDGSRTSDEISRWARTIARAVQVRLPKLAVWQMTKSLREGKVFIDWSQNNGAKTTISPYSMRGREAPTVAAPRRWDEIADADLDHLRIDEVLARLDADGDLLAVLLTETESAPEAADSTDAADDGSRTSSGGTDKLTTYRAKRDAAKTPEPCRPKRPARAAATASSSRSTTPVRCTGISGSSATAYSSPGQCRKGSRRARPATGSRCRQRTIRWSTRRFPARSHAASTAPAR